MQSEKGKRVTVKLKCPNPLFEKWLSCWKDEAIEKNSKTQYTYSSALQSLRKYPLPLESGKDCKILKGFGDKLCKMLDDKLKEYGSSLSKTQNDASTLISTIGHKKHSSGKKGGNKPSPSISSATTETSSKPYIPQYGSGAYAILVTLYEQSLKSDYKGFLLKTEIINHGKHLVNCSFTKPDPGSRYTAWSSVRTLITKNLVTKMNNPAKFSLTLEGVQLAKQLYEDSKNIDPGLSKAINKDQLPDEDYHMNVDGNEFDFPLPLNNVEENVTANINSKCSSNELTTISESIVNPTTGLKNDKSLKRSMSANTTPMASSLKNNLLKKHASSNSVSSLKSNLSSFEEFTMRPFSFDVILYVDNNETSGSSNSLQDEILIELTRAGVQFEVKDLKVSDFTWICRDRVSKNELVLPYAIERKRMDDFAQSIKDRRYYEQKFRLKRSGIENLTYLVESHGSNKHIGLPVQTLFQAATNTAIQENFFIKFTENTKDTAHYLINFSRVLVDIFKSKTLISCLKENIEPVDINRDQIALMSFKEFNHSSVKNKRPQITDVFVKILIQIKGMSVERALAITQKYPTPILLKAAFEDSPKELREKLLSSVTYGPNGKVLGAVLSKTVYQCFCNIKY